MINKENKIRTSKSKSQEVFTEMNSKNSREMFQYNYSGQQQEEIRDIHKRYCQQEVSEEVEKMEKLRQLDQRVQTAGTIPSILVGLAGTLVLGTGMACVLVWGGSLFVPGILLGITGIAGIAFAYPLSRILYQKRKKELTPEILRLTEELMQ